MLDPTQFYSNTSQEDYYYSNAPQGYLYSNVTEDPPPPYEGPHNKLIEPLNPHHYKNMTLETAIGQIRKDAGLWVLIKHTHTWTYAETGGIVITAIGVLGLACTFFGGWLNYLSTTGLRSEYWTLLGLTIGFGALTGVSFSTFLIGRVKRRNYLSEQIDLTKAIKLVEEANKEGREHVKLYTPKLNIRTQNYKNENEMPKSFRKEKEELLMQTMRFAPETLHQTNVNLEAEQPPMYTKHIEPETLQQTTVIPTEEGTTFQSYMGGY